MNSKNNLEMNNKIEICNEGKKAYDIVLRDSFADLLDQMEFLEIEKKKSLHCDRKQCCTNLFKRSL